MLTQLQKILQSKLPAHYTQQNKQIQMLQARLNHYLRQADMGLIGHVNIAIAQQGILVLMAHSPVWANRLRYLSSDILNHLRCSQADIEINDIQIRVHNLTIQQAPPAPAHKNKPAISRSSAELLQSAADHISDQRLKNTLQRIASLAKR